jgi:hypothetical protein
MGPMAKPLHHWEWLNRMLRKPLELKVKGKDPKNDLHKVGLHKWVLLLKLLRKYVYWGRRLTCDMTEIFEGLQFIHPFLSRKTTTQRQRVVQLVFQTSYTLELVNKSYIFENVQITHKLPNRLKIMGQYNLLQKGQSFIVKKSMKENSKLFINCYILNVPRWQCLILLLLFTAFFKQCMSCSKFLTFNLLFFI